MGSSVDEGACITKGIRKAIDLLVYSNNRLCVYRSQEKEAYYFGVVLARTLMDAL